MEAASNRTALQNALRVLAALQLTAPMWPPQAAVADGDAFDYVVVGAGSAGCVLAARLAELPARVLLLEAGGDPPLEAVLPGLMMYIPRSLQDWNHSAEYDGYEGRCHRNGRIELTRGRMLGGTGSANYMTYVRGGPADYEAWAEAAGDRSWAWSGLLPYFLKGERLLDEAVLLSPSGAFHGTRGDVAVTRRPREEVRRYLSAFRELGHDTPLDVTGLHNLGYTEPMFTIAEGRRQSSADAYLRPARARPNLLVLRHALATRVLLGEGRRAVGVRVRRASGAADGSGDGGEMTLRVRREVVLTAGALNSPQLLMLSGVGPRDHLRALGIPLAAHAPDVGRGLQDHVAALLAFRLRAPPGPPPPPPPPTEFPGALFLGFAAPGLAGARPAYQTANFVVPPNSTGALELCSVAFGLRDEICRGFGDAGVGAELLFTVLSVLHPRSRGRVSLRSADPTEPPLVELGFYSDERDLDAMVEYMEDFAHVAATSGLRAAGAQAVQPPAAACDGLAGRAWRRCWARCAAVAQFHLAGTCALGAVVDRELRVLGVPGLRVADASVMPSLPGGNINAPVLALAEKAADLIKRDFLDEFPTMAHDGDSVSCGD